MPTSAHPNERLCSNLELLRKAVEGDAGLKKRLNGLEQLAKARNLKQGNLDALLKMLPKKVRDEYRLFLPGVGRASAPIPSVFSCPEDLCPRTVPVEQARDRRPRCTLQDKDMPQQATML